MKTFLKIKIFLLITLLFALWQDITFSAEMTILNIHSQPQAGDNWIVSFETIGSADLTITPDDKTSIDDLDFISLKCGEEKRTPQTLEGGVIFYPDWFCNSEAKINHLVNITRAHILKFQFGDKIEYAYNSPDISVYDFSSGVETDKWAFEKGGFQPTNPNDINFILAEKPIDYNAISIDDNNRWQTSQTLPNGWDSQGYTFLISEPSPTITNLDLEWRGYGETSSGFDTYFYIWNQNSGSWSLLDSQDFTLESDGTLSGSITTNISNYIDAGRLTLMTTTQKPGTPQGQSCGGDGECISGFCRDGFCCNNNCSGDCEACNLVGNEGTCTVRLAGDDTECTTCKVCDGLDNISCKNVALSQEGKNCVLVCKECDGGGSCVDITNNTQDIQGSNRCSGTCQSCQSGSCSFASAGSDPGNKCDPGSTISDGCRLDYCDGSGVCTIAGSGDAGCPTCYTCKDTDEACEKYLYPEHDEDGCSPCKACYEGSCTYWSDNTTWGEDEFGCVGSNKRCYSGGCRTCGGVVANDRLGGRVCWYMDDDYTEGIYYSCNTVCGFLGNGGPCIDANWNDSTICQTCKYFFPSYSCSEAPSGLFYYYYPAIHESQPQCYYRPAGEDQDCSWAATTRKRLCACEY